MVRFGPPEAYDETIEAILRNAEVAAAQTSQEARYQSTGVGGTIGAGAARPRPSLLWFRVSENPTSTHSGE